MGTLDLNAEAQARKALREKDGKDPKVVKYKDLRVTLPDELPMEFAFLSGDGKLKEAFALIFGEKDNKTFWEYYPSTDDTKRLSEWLAEEYGFGPGESNPSEGT